MNRVMLPSAFAENWGNAWACADGFAGGLDRSSGRNPRALVSGAETVGRRNVGRRKSVPIVFQRSGCTTAWAPGEANYGSCTYPIVVVTCPVEVGPPTTSLSQLDAREIFCTTSTSYMPAASAAAGVSPLPSICS